MYINQKSFLNMKQINKLLVILLALVTFSSCETYGDYEIEYTAIYPLCGEWVVNVTGGWWCLGGRCDLQYLQYD